MAATHSAAQARSAGSSMRASGCSDTVLAIQPTGAAEIVPVAAHGERRGADRAAEIEGEDLGVARSGGTAAPSAPAARDLPAPVGPTISVWPTSPTCSAEPERRRPSVLREEQRRRLEMLIPFRPGPNRRERDHVREVQGRDRRLADIGVDVAGQRAEPGLDRVHAFRACR